MKRTAWVLMTVLATLVAVYSALVLTVPAFRPPFIRERLEIIPLAVMAHIAGGLVAMAVGAWQLNARLRDRARAAHRWMGRAYAVAVLVGGLGALRMAMVSQFGLVTHVGYGLLATLWLGTTMRAWLAIRAGDEATHRRWMIRSYSLTLAAVTLRLYLPLAAVLGAPYVEVYQVVSWMCWVPNLIIAEWVVLRGTPAPVAVDLP